MSCHEAIPVFSGGSSTFQETTQQHLCRTLNALCEYTVVGTRGLSVLTGHLALGGLHGDGERLLGRMARVLLNLDFPPLLDDKQCAAVGLGQSEPFGSDRSQVPGVDAGNSICPVGHAPPGGQDQSGAALRSEQHTRRATAESMPSRQTKTR